MFDSQDDYKELLEIVIAFLEGTSSQGIPLQAPRTLSPFCQIDGKNHIRVQDKDGFSFNAQRQSVEQFPLVSISFDVFVLCANHFHYGGKFICDIKGGLL